MIRFTNLKKPLKVLNKNKDTYTNVSTLDLILLKWVPTISDSITASILLSVSNTNANMQLIMQITLNTLKVNNVTNSLTPLNNSAILPTVQNPLHLI